MYLVTLMLQMFLKLHAVAAMKVAFSSVVSGVWVGHSQSATRRIVGLTLYRNFYYSFTTFQFAGQPTARETRLVTSHPDQIWPDH